ncbi:hypothetical protein [Mycoplasma marinum]|uniref:Uncharacterized protein n=1 Tax=Mycoplasma marinum TaxID=1937190 RepID=A0A4R0XR48_9MOLU|nr:hypothetical protein [Mycoplasma marinum]TCG11355.1 hypothetical protein C4B24_02275 [Mycoplasma marinum]
MTLNNLKLTSQIVDKFAQQVIPMSELRIKSKEIFSDRIIRISTHALNRMNERLDVKKEKPEYAQFIRSKIYGKHKIMMTYKTHDIFICDISFGEVDMTLVLKKHEEYYILITAYINSAERFVEFMKEQYSKEEKGSQVEQILKDSLFGGKSSEEFFNDFEKKYNLTQEIAPKPTANKNVKQKTPKQGKEVHRQRLDDEFMDKLINELKLPEFSATEKPETKKFKMPRPKPQVKTGTYQQSYDENYMDSLLNDNSLVQQSVEDIVEFEPETVQKVVISENDRETKIPEQKAIHKQELDDDLMKELLGDFA